MVEALLMGVASTALVERVRFLYQQAGEVLRGWRERRRDRDAPAPGVLEPPAVVCVEHAVPLADPPNLELVDTLQELKDLVEPIKDGAVDPQAPAARAAIANLRDVLEVILHSQIAFAGEQPRTTEVSDIDVVVDRVRGQVRGVRVALERLQGPMSVRRVRVDTGDVDDSGEVAGVDLT
jgi:hypothetical protein